MIKDIAVHLTGSSEDTIRLGYADALARRFSAHLTGLHVHALPAMLGSPHPGSAMVLEEMIERSRTEADKVTSRLTETLNGLGAHTELRRLDVWPGEAGKVLASEVRMTDLFVGTRPYGDPEGQSHIEEAVLFHSGRACIFLPPQRQVEPRLGSVLVAWKSSREAARAVAEAIPLLQQAGSVAVTLVEEGGTSHGSEPGADIGRYLSRHGVSAEIRMVRGGGDTGTALLKEAKALGADLIVMGGYGHSRLREFLLGGATRDVLANAEIPVLIAH